jgi:hypothetical protein
MHEQYGDRVRFQTVYIREAHPLDEWQMDSNEKEDVCYRQPKSMPDRLVIANDFVKRFNYPIPLAVDTMDDPVEKVYAGWPERFYIVDARGTIVYKGEPGPFGFHPEEVGAWLKKNFPT